MTEPLLELQNLAILNLHCNKFSDMKAIAPLAKLARLEKLTLQGNPIEELVPGYRIKVLTLVPWLRQLDYITVTPKVRVQEQLAKPCSRCLVKRLCCDISHVCRSTELVLLDVARRTRTLSSNIGEVCSARRLPSWREETVVV